MGDVTPLRRAAGTLLAAIGRDSVDPNEERWRDRFAALDAENDVLRDGLRRIADRRPATGDEWKLAPEPTSVCPDCESVEIATAALARADAIALGGGE